MIQSLSDLRRYLREDLDARGIKRWRWWHRFWFPVAAYQRKLRRTEFISNTLTGNAWFPVRAFAKYRLRRAGIRLGFDIHPNCFGPGLCIVHWGTVTISNVAKIGARCRVHPGVCLGVHDDAAPTVGDDCYFGPGAKAYGGIVLGNGTRVGPNAVVGRSYPLGGAVLTAPREIDICSPGATKSRAVANT